MNFHQGSFYSCLVPVAVAAQHCSFTPKVQVSFGDPDSPHNLTESLYKSQYLLNKHAAQRHVTNCSFDQTIAVNVICLSFACLFLFPASTQYPAGTPNLGGGVLATGRRRHKKITTDLVVIFLWCRWPDSNRHGIATGGF